MRLLAVHALLTTAPTSNHVPKTNFNAFLITNYFYSKYKVINTVNDTLIISISMKILNEKISFGKIFNYIILLTVAIC